MVEGGRALQHVVLRDFILEGGINLEVDPASNMIQKGRTAGD
jgi:hypothetical protein